MEMRQGRQRDEQSLSTFQMETLSPVLGRNHGDDLLQMGSMYGMPLFQSAGPDLRSAAHWLWQVEAAELEGSFVVAEKLFDLALQCRAEVNDISYFHF